MNKFWKLTLGLIVGLILFFIVRSIIVGPTPYLTLEFEPKNEIFSYSTIQYVDTLSHIGLEYLGVSDLNISVLDARPHVIRNILPGHTVDGFVIQTNQTSYQIWMNPKLNRNAMITILSHELIHIEQQSSGRLEIISNELAVFEGDTIRTKEVQYEHRPWEREAYNKQREVSRYIRSKVF